MKATRIFAVADRLCVLAEGDLTPSALQRLVYYSQGLAFATLDEPLFDELPRAAASGPVYDRIFEGYPFEEIQRVSESTAPVEDDPLTQREIEVIDAAYQRFGNNSGQALSRMSRNETPWKKARKRAGVADGEDCNEQITAKSMRKYFSKL